MTWSTILEGNLNRGELAERLSLLIPDDKINHVTVGAGGGLDAILGRCGVPSSSIAAIRAYCLRYRWDARAVAGAAFKMGCHRQVHRLKATLPAELFPRVVGDFGPSWLRMAQATTREVPDSVWWCVVAPFVSGLDVLPRDIAVLGRGIDGITCSGEELQAVSTPSGCTVKVVDVVGALRAAAPSLYEHLDEPEPESFEACDEERADRALNTLGLPLLRQRDCQYDMATFRLTYRVRREPFRPYLNNSERYVAKGVGSGQRLYFTATGIADAAEQAIAGVTRPPTLYDHLV